MRLANAPDANEKDSHQALSLVQMHESAVQGTADPHRFLVTLTLESQGWTTELLGSAWIVLGVALRVREDDKGHDRGGWASNSGIQPTACGRG